MNIAFPGMTTVPAASIDNDVGESTNLNFTTPTMVQGGSNIIGTTDPGNGNVPQWDISLVDPATGATLAVTRQDGLGQWQFSYISAGTPYKTTDKHGRPIPPPLILGSNQAYEIILEVVGALSPDYPMSNVLIAVDVPKASSEPGHPGHHPKP